MMSNNLNRQFQQIDEMLKSARKILVASHENPDPDAVASVLALHYFFKKKNFESFPYLPDSPSKYLSFLPGFFEIQTSSHFLEKSAGETPDLLFCLDYGDFKRLKIPEHILQNNSLNIITIDHHLESDQRGAVKVLEPQFSSTAEIIYRWMFYENFEISHELAVCLLVGIFSDSGGLKHVSTNSATFRTVSELLLKGASLNKIIRSTLAFQPNRTYDGVGRAWGRILDRINLNKKTGLAYSWINAVEFKDFGIKNGDFDGLVNLIAAGSPVNLGLFLVEHRSGEIKGSLRSEPSGKADVAKIARYLGGGGHPYAAGFQQKGSIEETLKKVLNLIE